MMTFIKMTMAFIFGLCSCSNNQSVNSSSSGDKAKVNVIRGSDTPPVDSNLISDTIKRFIVDDYPLTDDMFGRDINGREIKSGMIVSLDKV